MDEFSRSDRVTMATACAREGRAADEDERLHCAEDFHDLAARLWGSVGECGLAALHRGKALKARRLQDEAMRDMEEELAL